MAELNLSYTTPREHARAIAAHWQTITFEAAATGKTGTLPVAELFRFRSGKVIEWRAHYFDACLVAINASGCADTVCKQVSTLVVPSVDVPNAFTPNSGDVNSKVLVRGYGIVKMKFIIWNRWGQKVFESANPNDGWDGRYKGVLQPMDVYAFTLDVEFFDGTKSTKTGDITLIR